jgi:VWFA-related protein
MIRTIAAATGTLLLAGLASEPAQNPPPALQTFRTGVDIVQVDVSVLDRDRRPVRGLAAADFTILEDGQERPVVAFSAIDLPAPADTTPSWMRDVSPDVVSNIAALAGRLVVILMDRTIRPQSQPMGRRIAEAAVNALGPGDLAAVIYSGPGVPQNFTADRGLLLSAIKRPFIALQDRDMGNPGECYCGSCSLEAMTHVAEALRDVPQRRKSLLFIGDSVGILDWDYEPPIFEDCEPAAKVARENLTRAAQAANLTLHAFDPRGLEVRGLDASMRSANPLASSAALRVGQQSRLDALRVLTDVTDGRTVLNTNAPEDQVASVMLETSSYYVLGFQSADATGGGRAHKAHKIEVKVNRRGVRVQSRRGHGSPVEASSRSNSADEPATALNDAVRDLLPKTGLEIAVTALPFASADRAEADVIVALGVREPPNPKEPADSTPREAESVEIFTGAFDREGRNVAWLRQKVDVKAEARTTGLRYDALARLQLTPGRYEIRVAVQHRQAERVGSVYAYVDVPEFAKGGPWLSGVVLAGAQELLATPTDAVADVSPVVPASRREFPRTGNLTAFVRVYRGGDDAAPVTVRARIVDATSKTVFDNTVTLQVADLARDLGAEVRLDLPLDRATPGQYLLTIEATRAGRETARRDVRFSVR